MSPDHRVDVSNWEPVLAESQRSATIELLSGIVDLLSDPTYGRSRVEIEGGEDAGLAQGLSGEALFFMYHFLCTGDGRSRQLGIEWLNRAADLLASGPNHPSLHAGLVGPAWVGAHLSHALGEDTIVADAEFDEALLTYWRGSTVERFDLMHGALGIGVYFMERGTPESVGGVRLIYEWMKRRAVRDRGGIAWRTHYFDLPADQHDVFREGQWNFGLAHGQPAVIAWLRAAADFLGSEEPDELRRDAIRWLLGWQRKPSPEQTAFPTRATDSGEPVSSLMYGWCHGDLGVALGMLLGEHQADPPDWTKRVVAAARTFAVLPAESLRLNDPSFCHGSAGVAHMFARLYQATGDAAFADAARRMYTRLLSSRSQNSRDPFLFSVPKESVELFAMVPRRGVLVGLAGVGLVLLAATFGIAPHWDRVCMLSTPGLPPRFGVGNATPSAAE